MTHLNQAMPNRRGDGPRLVDHSDEFGQEGKAIKERLQLLVGTYVSCSRANDERLSKVPEAGETEELLIERIVQNMFSRSLRRDVRYTLQEVTTLPVVRDASFRDYTKQGIVVEDLGEAYEMVMKAVYGERLYNQSPSTDRL